MKNISRLRMMAVLGLAVMAATPALAKGDLQKQRRAAEDAAYWQNKNQGADRAARSGESAQMRTNVSQYPCAGCVYDNAAGGYVYSASPRKR